MGKIFKTRKDVKIFAVLILIFIVLLSWIFMIRSFEGEWYNMEYEDYKKHSDEYVAAQGTIKEFITDTHKNNPGLTTIFDRYFTAVVEIEYVGGQTELYKIPRQSGDKIGDKVNVAYDKRYDTDYDTMIEAGENVGEEYYSYAPRLEEVNNNRYSSVLIVIESLYAVFIVLFVIRCSKKPDKFTSID